LVLKYFLLNNYYNNYFFNSSNYLKFYLFLGTSFLNRNDSDSILNSIFLFFFELKLSTQNFNIISRNLGRLSSFEIGVFPKIIKLKKNNKFFNFFIGIDEKNIILKKTNINVFQGFFYISSFFEYINLILPTSIFSEKQSSYINLEGRFRYTNKAVIPFKYIFLDSSIIECFFIL
jgi:hypothetical protein